MVKLYVTVPIGSYRVPRAREYLETLPVPPPSTVYGMLLSLVGEEDRRAHIGAEVALFLLDKPRKSTLLRTTWRIKAHNVPLGVGQNRRPDFQEVLSGIRLAVFVRDGAGEGAQPTLAGRVAAALETPDTLRRYGGLCLGESTHLVDEVRPLRFGDAGRPRVLLNDAAGELALPVWPDHVASGETTWGQYRLVDVEEIGLEPDEAAWTPIMPSRDVGT